MSTRKVGKHFQFMDEAQAVVPLTDDQAEAFESLSAICKETEALKARVAALEAERDELTITLGTIVGYAEEFTDGQSVKTRQRLGMAMTYAAAVLRHDPDPMKAVAAHWSDDRGLVTHFAPSRWSEREAS